MTNAFDIHPDDVASKHNELCKMLIGKVLRNRHKMPVGTIVSVDIERNEHYKKTYFYAVLDNGDRINTTKLKGAR